MPVPIASDPEALSTYPASILAPATARVDRTTGAEKVRDALVEVRMEDYEDRYSAERSGGQQQRIALVGSGSTPPDAIRDRPT